VNDSSMEEAENPGLDTVLHVGDRVCVFLPATELKEVQRGRGGWSMRMTEVNMSYIYLLVIFSYLLSSRYSNYDTSFVFVRKKTIE
jgi:hypothetical protein